MDPLANRVANAVNMLLGSVLGAFRHIIACCGAEGGDFVICMAPTNRWVCKLYASKDSSTQRGPSPARELQGIRAAVHEEYGDLRTHRPSLGKDLRIAIFDSELCLA